jgi:hypothetical protein
LSGVGAVGDGPPGDGLDMTEGAPLARDRGAPIGAGWWLGVSGLALGWVVAVAALALPDPGRWEPGARLALAALALGTGASLPLAGAGGLRAMLVALPPLALGASLEHAAVVGAVGRAGLALGVIGLLGFAAGRCGRMATRGGVGGLAFGALALAVAVPLLVAVLEAHGSEGAPAVLVELARWSPLQGLYGLAQLDLVVGGGRALVGSLACAALAAGVRGEEGA